MLRMVKYALILPYKRPRALAEAFARKNFHMIASASMIANANAPRKLVHPAYGEVLLWISWRIIRMLAHVGG